MQIAGVQFRAECRKPIALEGPGSRYKPFIEKENGSRPDIDIEIRLDPENTPPVETFPKTFEGDDAWSMSRKGEDYWLTLSPPAFEHPLWIAKINRDFTKASVYCGAKLVHEKDGAISVRNPVAYPLDQILLMYFLANRGGAIFHAAGVVMHGKSFIFPGRSGAGKSTIMRQFAAGEETRPLSDDRMVVRRIGGEFTAFGTPWPGEEEIAENASAPLSGIFFIRHGSANRIEALKRREAMENILPVASIPWYDRRIMPEILDFCGDLISRVPTYRLCFKPDLEVVDVFKNFISP